MEMMPKYHLPQIEAWVSKALPPPASFAKKDRSKHPTAIGDNKQPELDAVRAGCSWVDARAGNPRMEEPSWYALASIVGYCREGEQLFHEISELDERYDQKETAEKLRHAITDAKPRTCSNIRGALGHPGCDSCVFSGKIASPVALGYRPPEIVELMKGHVLETETGRYLDLETGVFSSTRAFNDRYSHITRDVSPHTKLAKDVLTRKVQIAAYLPGSSQLFQTLENGQEAVNLWKPTELQLVDGDCEAINRHIQAMFPDDVVREHFLNSLAFMMQHPGEKIAHAFVLTGKQGTGKSLLFELVKMLFGKQNCRTIESNSLGMRFNAHMANVQLLIIEELWTAERRETYNGIKTLITARTMAVEEKNIPIFEARTPDFILATSNHDTPVTLEVGDRRFCIYESPMEPQGREYYDTLAAAIEQNAGAFLSYLHSRDITAFDPNRAPPVTDAKREVMNSSRSQITQEVEAMVEENDPVFWREMVSLNDVRAGLARRLAKMPTQNEVKSALKAIGAINLGVVRISSHETSRLWAWKHPDRWAGASAEEVRGHMTELGPSSR
jgi:hypothetical protein